MVKKNNIDVHKKQMTSSTAAAAAVAAAAAAVDLCNRRTYKKEIINIFQIGIHCQCM
jgi:hypothetical protein